jgi:uncharacterized protein
MTYYYYKDSKGEWRWRLKASNGRILVDSGEGYKQEQEWLDDINRWVKTGVRPAVCAILATKIIKQYLSGND